MMTMTADDLAVITFNELKHLNDEDLAMCVSKEAAIKICKKSIGEGSNTEAVAANEIFHLWVHKLNKIFEVDKCDVAEWQQLLEFFMSMVQQVTSLDVKDSKFQLADLLDILADTLELLHWLLQLPVALGTRKCCLTLQFALQTVAQFFAFYNSSNLQGILEQTLLIYNLALQVLSNVDNCRLNDSDEFAQLIDVQSTLCTVIADAPALSLKTVIESWKCITKLTLHCAKYANEMKGVDEKLLVGIALKPIIFLIQEVRRSLNMVYREETLRQSIEQVEKYLRITNFYLKLLQRLAEAFHHERFPCIREFLDIFIAAKSPPKYLSNTSLLSCVGKYVLTDLDEVFQMLYKHQHILKILAQKSTALKSTEFSLIAKEFLRASLVDKKEDFIREKIELFIGIFQSFAKDLEKFCDSSTYNEMLESFAALAILNQSGELKKYLRSEVLSADFQLAHASTDVLLTIVSSSQESARVELLDNFRYWRKCNENFALFTHNPRELEVLQLLRHHFLRSRTWGILNKEVHFVDLKQIKVTSLRLLKALPELAIALGFSLKKMCDTFLTQNIEDYYKILIALQSLAHNQEFECDRNLAGISSLLHKIGNITTPHDSIPFTRFCSILLEFEANYIERLDDEAINSTFRILKQHATKLSDCILPALYSFIQAAAVAVKAQRFEQIAKDLLSQLITMKDAQMLGNIFVCNKFKNLENCKINNDLWPQLSLRSFLRHNCHADLSPATKRLRLADVGASSTSFMLNEMLEKSQKLLRESSKLNEHDLDLLKRIKMNLNNLERGQEGLFNGS